MFSTALEALDTLAVRGGIRFFRMAQPVTKVAAILLELHLLPRPTPLRNLGAVLIHQAEAQKCHRYGS
jgi:hypothetical protein